MGEGGALDPLREDSAAGLEGWLQGAGGEQAGGVIEIRLCSRDPEDLTLREARLLGSADVLAFEPLVPQAILDRGRADAMRLGLRRDEAPPPLSGLIVVLRAAKAGLEAAPTSPRTAKPSRQPKSGS